MQKIVCLALTNAALVMSFLGTGCGDDDRAENPSDARVSPDAAACALGLSFTRDTFVAASREYLAEVYPNSGSDFSGGSVRYSEAWVALSEGECPLADWSALTYVVPIDAELVPEELRDTHHHVAVPWILLGERFVVLLSDEVVAGEESSPWASGTLPDSFVAIAEKTASPQAVSNFIDGLIAAHPGATVSWLDAIGFLTVQASVGTLGDGLPRATTVIDAVAADVRGSALFEAPVWDGQVFRYPNSFDEDWADVTLDDVSTLAPECLRSYTKERRDSGFFTTMPSLAQPLGSGPIDNPNACP